MGKCPRAPLVLACRGTSSIQDAMVDASVQLVAFVSKLFLLPGFTGDGSGDSSLTPASSKTLSSSAVTSFVWYAIDLRRGHALSDAHLVAVG